MSDKKLPDLEIAFKTFLEELIVAIEEEEKRTANEVE